MLMNVTPPLKELVPVTPRGEATRKKLLASAEIEFGSKGFPAASVSSITQRADVGQGTFYLYFHSKEEVFATLVRELGRDQRDGVTALLSHAAVKREGERLLAEKLLDGIASEPGRYRILREAQFVDEPVFRETQEQLFQAIAEVLVLAGRGGAGPADAAMRAAAIAGAAEHAALRHCLWTGKPPSRALAEAVLSR